MRISKLFILLISSYSLCAQSPLVKMWDARFGGTGKDVFTVIRQTTDGGFMLGGYSQSDSNGDKTQPLWGVFNAADYWIVKVDALGNKQWDKRFGGTDRDELMTLEQTTDGGYILGGGSLSMADGDKSQPAWLYNNTTPTSDYWVVKIDAAGNKQWDKRFGGTNSEVVTSLQQTDDKGFILAGTSGAVISGEVTEPPRGGGDYWLVKIDSLGNKQWDRRFGGSDHDRCYSVRITRDRGYILTGMSYSDSSGDKTQHTWDIDTVGYNRGDFWVVKIDSAGNKQWDKRFGGFLIDGFPFSASYGNISLESTTDGGYILGGTSSSNISGDKTENNRGTGGGTDYWIVKIDSLGNKQWDKRFGGTHVESECHVFQTPDGGYLLSGSSKSMRGGDKSEDVPYIYYPIYQVWLVKTDSFGNKQWDKTITTSDNGDFYNLGEGGGYAIQAGESCYLIGSRTIQGIGGYKTQPNWGTAYQMDYWIVKFCDSTQLCPPLSLNFIIAVAKPELNNGAMRVLVSGGDAPYLYSLDSLTFQMSNTFTSLGLGTYQVYVTDNNGCTGQGTFTIDETNCNCTRH